MSVNPGFGGESFIEMQVKKIADLRRVFAEKVIEAGENALVARSAVFGAKSYVEAISGIKASKRSQAATVAA